MDLYDRVNELVPVEQMKVEIMTAMNIIASTIPRPSVVMEIGSYYGGTLTLLASLLTDDGLIISIDPQLQVLLMTEGIRGMIGNRALVHINGYSCESVDEVLGVLDGRKVDVLHIDGDHTDEGSQGDWDLYYPMMNHPGVVLIHDINDQFELGPSNLFRGLMSDYRCGIVAVDMRQYGIGVIYV